MSRLPQNTYRPSENDNFETFCLFWLDASVNKFLDKSKSTPRLRANIDYLKKFSDPEECEKRIRSISESERIVLIVSGSFNRQIVPRIHSLPELSAIYVFCMNLDGNRQWVDSFNRVELVTTDIDNLIEAIIFNQQVPQAYDEPLSFLVSV